MLDVVYIVGTIAFFGLMLGYVSLCEKLGQSADESIAASESRP